MNQGGCSYYGLTKGIVVRMQARAICASQQRFAIAFLCGAKVEVVKRTEAGFQVLPRRWVVERTLGWLGRYRRLSKDYELLPEVSESMIYAAMVRLMLGRLAS